MKNYYPLVQIIETKRFFLLSVMMALTFTTVIGQAVDTLKIALPSHQNWNVVSEGESISVKIGANRPDSLLQFTMQAPLELGMELTEKGQFNWNPSSGLVSDKEKIKVYHVMFKVTDGVQRDSVYAEFSLKNKVDVVIPASRMPRITDLEFPLRGNWKLLHEGDTLSFKLNAKTSNGLQHGISYQLEEGDKSSIQFDSLGNFFWIPEYDYVDRLQQVREKHIFFVAEDYWGNVVSEKMELSIFHKNRKPVVENLKPFYVLLGSGNTFEINSSYARDPDGDPIVFVTKDSDLPEGMEFSSNGRVSWTPSRNQFNSLRREPLKVPFFVEDQPDKERTLGFLFVEASKLDMPPEITVLPSDTAFSIDENERLHLVFHLSDPNGDDDVEEFGFVSDDPRLKQELMRKNTDTQFEFLWTPGYEFVNDPNLFLDVTLRFFVLDKSRKTTEKTIHIKIKDTEDLAKKDAQNYVLYKEILVETMNLMDQLTENQTVLEKELKLAKRGKKNRALVNAAIGAVTGLSPVISADNTQKTISVIGGTSTLTLGSLEAKDVIGRSVSNINTKIKLNTDLYNQFLSEGTSLARRYNSKLERRNQNFSYDLEKLKKIINSPKLAELELDASWENKKKLTDRRLKSTFTDFDIIDLD